MTDPANQRPPAVAEVQSGQSQALELLREDLRLVREQLEQSRRETATEREAERLSSRLREVEAGMAARALKDADAIRDSNRFVVVAAAVLVGVGLLILVALAWFQWRVFTRLVESPNQRLLGPSTSMMPEQVVFTPTAAAERSNFKLTNALLQLEQRLADLERAGRQSNTTGSGPSQANSEPKAGPHAKTNGSVHSRNGADETIQVLLARGQALLNAERLDEALVTFDQVLSLHPHHAETLVKRGVALERLGRVNEAISSHDLAIAADPAYTAAYLHKGGLFNKLERYGEALECYETALRLKERRAG